MRVIRNDSEPDPALAKFSRKFSHPSRPSAEVPDLPKHLDDLGDDDLMDLYTEFMSWVSYAKAEMVHAEIDEEREANFLRILEAKVLIEQWGAEAKGDRVTIAKARRDIDSRVVSQQDAHRQARAYRKLVEAMFDRCDRGAQLLSRELSRRIGLHSRESRSGRFGA